MANKTNTERIVELEERTADLYAQVEYGFASHQKEIERHAGQIDKLQDTCNQILHRLAAMEQRLSDISRNLEPVKQIPVMEQRLSEIEKKLEPVTQIPVMEQRLTEIEKKLEPVKQIPVIEQQLIEIKSNLEPLKQIPVIEQRLSHLEKQIDELHIRRWQFFLAFSGWLVGLLAVILRK